MSVIVSVIVPSLNVSNYIRECVESILSQSLSNIEIICIDAGSSDGTRDILEEYTQNDSRIRLIDSPVKSYGYQVNMGIKMALGEYISIVESDDYVDKDMMWYLYQQAKDFDADVSKGNFFRVCGNTHEAVECEEQQIFLEHQHHFYNKRIENDELLFRHTIDQNLWNGIYRRDFLLKRKIKLNETPGAAFQDMGFQQQVQTLATSVVYGDKPIYYYRTDRDDSSTNQPKWLHNVVQEFIYLQNSHLWQEKESLIHKPYVIARLAVAFMTELRRIIIKKDFSLKEDTWLDDYTFLQKEFKKLISEDVLAYWQLTRWMWEHLNLAIRSLKSYADFLWMQEEFRKITKEKYISIYQKESYVIFSCGAWGKVAAQFLKGQGKNVLAFADNAKNNWGKTILDTRVISPKEAVEQYQDIDFIVANQYYGDKIKNQLLDMGIPAHKITIYHPI